MNMRQSDFPTLESERLILRPLIPEDTDFIFKHFSDPQVNQYLLDNPPVADYAEAEEIVQFYLEPEGKSYNRWGLMRKSDQRLIGTCGYHRWEKRYFRAEIGYDLSPDFWGKGYMREALSAAIGYGLERMYLNRIDALVYVDNMPSSGLLQRLGFKEEGILRDYFYLNGQFYDHYLFALLKSEWEA